MQEFQDKRTREQARRGILSKGLQGEELATELERGGFLDDATPYRKSIDERQDSRIKREGEIVKLYGELSRAVLANPPAPASVTANNRITEMYAMMRLAFDGVWSGDQTARDALAAADRQLTDLLS